MGQVVSDTKLLELIARDRRDGRSIAFANGCFDFLHVGHVRYLAGAAAEGDRLVVAINDDASVRGLKGEGRPMLPSADRAELVASLRGVDYVVVFPEPNVERLLTTIKPDVHCKGTDYTVDTVPERETVRAYGGRIAIVGDPKDHSTRALVDKVRSSKFEVQTKTLARILIVRLGSLGDLVHTLPAVAAIRRAHPTARIDWLVDAVHQDFLELVPILSSVVVLRDRGARGWLAVRRELRANEYDVALDFQGLLKSAGLARLSGAANVLGFERSALREGAAAPLYTQRVSIDSGQHVIRKNLQLASAVGAAVAFENNASAFPIAPVDVPAISSFVASLGGPYALVNPGAAWPNKRWPAEKLAEVAREIHARHGLVPVILWGPGEEEVAHAIVNWAGGTARLAPPTGLRDLVALMRGASLMLSGDTGPTHIAAALGVPIVALFGPTDAARNGPWAADDISISRYEACDCHYERKCRRDASQWCLGTIQVDEVTSAIDARLRTAARAAQVS